MIWEQTTLVLTARPRGFHLITGEIERELAEFPRVRVGWLHLFLQHTSASLTLNENASPDVKRDLEMAFHQLCPENLPYRHTEEGPDDMPAHVKSSLLGNSLLLPISDGRLALGTWQGVMLCEHRNAARGRSLLLTLTGSPG